MTRVLTGRLNKFSENHILTGSGWIQARERMSDHVLVLRNVCNIMKSQGRQTFLAFLDVSKTYDTVWRDRLWMKISEYGFQEGFVNVCKHVCRS